MKVDDIDMGDVDNATLKALFPGSPDKGDDGPVDHPHGPVDRRDFKRSWEYKYVRFADGTVLFCDASAMGMSHKALVVGYPLSKPVSAGKIQVRDGKWCLSGYGSDSANLGHDNADEDALKALLADQLELDWDIRY